MSMSKSNDDPYIVYIKEPELMFGQRQRSDNPKDGLFLYGPHSSSGEVKEVRIGAVGTKSGLKYLRRRAIAIGGIVKVPPPTKREKKDRLHLSNFPGLEEAFNIRLNPAEFVNRAIDVVNLDEATRTLNRHEAVRKTVDIYINEIEQHDRNEERTVDLWVLVLPELIFERCKPLSKRIGLQMLKGEFPKKQKERLDLPLFAGIIDQSDEEIFDDVPDFHRQVKARLLKYGHATQLIRETTLAPEEFVNKAGYPKRRLQEPATLAWNLATGIYYKTQPEPPWRLAGVRPRVCYLGLVFKLIPNDPQDYVCCAAQMFLNEGDGMVFRGANGPWKTGDYEYHLKAPEAKSLVKRVIDTFIEKHGQPPEELFIHGRTKFSDVEWNAFTKAVPPETKLIGVRIKPSMGENKLFREGDYPVLRGTALVVDKTNAYLWTNGYVPKLDSYIGPETPNPLYITVLRSTSDMPNIENVLTDIMGLTKINYNACNYSDGLPVTIRFANKVGQVLTMGSAKDAERQPLKFYI